MCGNTLQYCGYRWPELPSVETSVVVADVSIWKERSDVSSDNCN